MRTLLRDKKRGPSAYNSLGQIQLQRMSSKCYSKNLLIVVVTVVDPTMNTNKKLTVADVQK
jgi:hypothetical protein